ncbi:hypothetical protein ACNFJ7_06230 [Sphingomonas sp. HT-1]|uniref:hypothetical protein n=1 Tax=unclassified Sphingomonas TaxID=196159 RepID=UPI0002F7F2CC|nr:MULTISPECIES: hypothetical protein [unclassified Sphingomonas]KTF69594.1 hypothetical protein ATB93_08425 [Sphingomonas sp. WG]
MKLRTFAILAGACLMLAACGDGDESTSPPDANVTEITVPETSADMNISTEEPAAMPTENAAPEPLPTATPTPFSDQEQTEADAAATGMTSRIDRDAERDGEEKNQ